MILFLILVALGCITQNEDLDIQTLQESACNGTPNNLKYFENGEFCSLYSCSCNYFDYRFNGSESMVVSYKTNKTGVFVEFVINEDRIKIFTIVFDTRDMGRSMVFKQNFLTDDEKNMVFLFMNESLQQDTSSLNLFIEESSDYQREHVVTRGFNNTQFGNYSISVNKLNELHMISIIEKGFN